jgi:hypothetical protein
MPESGEPIHPAIRKLLHEVQIRPSPIDPPPPSQRFVGSSTEVAVALCHDAWQHTYDDCMKKDARNKGGPDEFAAAREASAAFRAAMPQLAGYDGIRDFIACVAYGVLIDAIPADRAGQLLYAAQVALTVYSRR